MSAGSTAGVGGTTNENDLNELATKTRPQPLACRPIVTSVSAGMECLSEGWITWAYTTLLETDYSERRCLMAKLEAPHYLLNPCNSDASTPVDESCTHTC